MGGLNFQELTKIKLTDYGRIEFSRINQRVYRFVCGD